MEKQTTQSSPPFRDMPTLELEAIPSKMAELMEREQQLAEQEKGLQAFTDLRQDYVARVQALESYREQFPDDMDTVDRIWKRLWSEPHDPVNFAHHHYQKQLNELQQTSMRLLQELQQTLQSRTRVLASWRNLLHEVSHRLHLLQRLNDYLEPLEEQINALEATPIDAMPAPPMEEPQEATVVAPPPAPPSEAVTSNELAQKFAPETSLPHHDKRESTRLVLGTVVNFGENEHTLYTGFSENISEGGLFVSTYALRPEIGETFVLNFSLPDRTNLELQAEVSWIREYSPLNPGLSPGFGCKFINVPEEEKQIINDFIRREGALLMPEDVVYKSPSYVH